MLKKLLIFGLILLVVGGLTLFWIINQMEQQEKLSADCRAKIISEPDPNIEKFSNINIMTYDHQIDFTTEIEKYRVSKTPEKLQQEQNDRLLADKDKLASGQMDPGPIADILYGDNWQQKVEKYSKQKERNEFIFSTSMVTASLGALVFGLCSITGIINLLTKTMFKSKNQNNDTDQTDENKQPKEDYVSNPDIDEPNEFEQTFIGRKRLSESRPKLNGRPKIHEYSGWYDVEMDFANNRLVQIAPMDDSENNPENQTQTSEKSSAVAVLDSPDDETQQLQESDYNQPQLQSHYPETDDSIQQRTESLEKQFEQLKQMTQSSEQATSDESSPISDTLVELTQQISAIREYAATQQNRVEKLQDGYDWNIIRTFCIKIIRCIDNIQNRINKMSQQGIETNDLEEIRDEMIFALESSGVEQYSPEINSNYRGQEKYAEALKEKCPCSKPELAGKIAEVVRGGYQYFIDDENAKIVRTAQVKLYG